MILVSLVFVAASAGANDGVDAALEIRDDPYLAADPHVRQASPAAVVERGSFSSTQVNVDRNGFNIFGDAGNEPSIAVDPTNRNRITIGWRQFDNIASNFRQAGWAFSNDGGRTWTFPGVLTPGIFRSDPVLDADAMGRVYYNSLRSEATFFCEVFGSDSSGYQWDEPVYAHGGDKQWMTIDRTGGVGDGNIYSHWNVNWSAEPGVDFNRSTNDGGSFDTPAAMPHSPYWGTTTVAPNGTVYVVGLSSSGTHGISVARASTIANPGNPTTFDDAVSVDLGGLPVAFAGPGSPNPSGLHGQVWIAADHSGGANHGFLYIVSSVNPAGSDPLDVHFTRSTDGGDTWSTPVRVNKDPAASTSWQWFGTLSVAPNGRIDVVWNSTHNDPSGYDSELLYSFSNDGGATWSADTPMSPPFDPHLGWPNQSKIGDYYHMVSDDLGADLAWAGTFNGEQDVYYLRIGDRDCNGNGVGDSTEADGDGDGIINACDNCPGMGNPRQFDRNFNGVGDVCDTFIFGDGLEWASDAAWSAVAP
jgi:hypothetical protein